MKRLAPRCCTKADLSSAAFADAYKRLVVALEEEYVLVGHASVPDQAFSFPDTGAAIHQLLALVHKATADEAALSLTAGQVRSVQLAPTCTESIVLQVQQRVCQMDNQQMMG